MAFDLISRKHTEADWSRDGRAPPAAGVFHVSMGGDDEPLVWTPAAARSEFERVRGVLDAVNLEVSEASKQRRLAPGEWDLWHRFYLDAHKFTTDSSSWWGSNVARARQLEAEALRWRKLVISRGGKVIGPERGPAEGPSAWRWLAAGLAGATAAMLLAHKIGGSS